MNEYAPDDNNIVDVVSIPDAPYFASLNFIQKASSWSFSAKPTVYKSISPEESNFAAAAKIGG